MPGFNSMRQLVDAENNGQRTLFTWRKTATQATAQGFWFDLSMSPGNPVPQYYAATPLVARTLTQSADGGLFHGSSPAPAQKVLRRVMAIATTATPLPMPMILCDYLLFYPFCDEGTTDVQTLDNTTTLPRWTDGAGVQVMAVIVGGQTGGQTFQFSYTNSAGVAGRTSATVTMNSSTFVNGAILNAARQTAGCFGPFIPLQTGDTGVRSIQSVTCNGEDVGLFCLVLVKPLGQMMIRGIDAPVEVDYFKDFSQCPVIAADAYLNFLCCPNGSLSSAPIHGTIETSWN